MANGMAGLFVGASGLKTAQTALNTTAHKTGLLSPEQHCTGFHRIQVLNSHSCMPGQYTDLLFFLPQILQHQVHSLIRALPRWKHRVLRKLMI